MKLLGIPLVWILLSGSIITPIGFLTAFGIVGGEAANQTIPTTVSSSINPSVFGQSVTFTATVSPNTSTGTVQFNDTSTSPPVILGTGTITSGHAIFTTSSLSVGNHNIVAKYLGDVNNAPSTSAVLTQTVNQVITTTAILASPNPSTLGHQVTFGAVVSPMPDGGAIQFQIDGANFGTPVTVVSGAAVSGSISTLGAGSHVIRATYSGTSNFAGSSNTITQTVSSASLTATGTNVAPIEGISLQGIVAHFTDADPNAVASDFTATINWGDGGTTNAVIIANSNGGFDVQGTRTYAEEGSYSLSTTINDNDGTTATVTSTATVADAPLTATATNINSMQGISLQGIVAHFTDADPNAVASDFTATINWGDGGTTNAVIIANSNGGFDVQGTHTYATAGIKSVSIATNDIGGSLALATGTATVNTISTSTTTSISSSHNPSTVGQSVTFTATVLPNTATGTVQFNDTSTSPPTILGTGTITSGIATFTTSSLSVGSHNMVAKYLGDVSHAPSTGAVLTQTVNTISTSTTTSISSSHNPSTVGQSVTFTATVLPNTATGTVQFNDTNTSPPTILGTGTITSGHAIFTTSSLSVGNHNIVAKYLGDTNNVASVSSALTQTVNKISTTILSLNAASITLGQSVTFIVSVSPPDATSSVQFQVNGTNFGSPVALSGGQAAFTTSSLPLGTDNVSVSYSGGTIAGPSTSNSITITVSSTAQGTTNTHAGENDDQENDDNENDHQNNSNDDSNNQQNNSDDDGDGKQKEKRHHQHEGKDN